MRYDRLIFFFFYWKEHFKYGCPEAGLVKREH